VKDVKTKYLEICNTFLTNTASVRFRPIIMEMLKAEANSPTPQSNYDQRAAEYYAKHGTVGEF
jgi:hypothetical protein